MASKFKTSNGRTPEYMAEIERSLDEYTRLENFFSDFMARVGENKEMAPKKKEEAMQTLNEEVIQLQEMVAEEQRKCLMDIDQLVPEHEGMLNYSSRYIKKYTGQIAAAYNILKKVVESPEGQGPTDEEVQQAQQILKQTSQTVRKDQTNLDEALGMMRNVVLSTTNLYAELTNRLRTRSLFFLKTCSLYPQDVSLTLGSQATSGLYVGNMIEIQVEPIRADSSVKRLMTYDIKDDANNVLEYNLKDDIRNRAGGFVIQFTPHTPGKHVVTVELYEQPIKNSPMLFNVEQYEFCEVLPEERSAPVEYSVTTSRRTERVGIQGLPESSADGETESVLAVTFPNLGRDRPNLVQMYNENLKKKGIYGRHLLTIGTWNKNTNPRDHLNNPIGCTRDEVSGIWIICDSGNNAVKLFNADGSPNMVIQDNLVKPSAVVMIDKGVLAEEVKPDRMFAVKDNFCIHLYNSSGNFMRKIGEDSLRKPIGLALDSSGLLVTLNDASCAGATTELMFFDPSTGQLVKRIPFWPVMDAMPPWTPRTRNRRGSPQPRFMDAHGDRLIVSDSSLNQVYIVDLSSGAEICRFGKFERFKLITGITIDRDYNIVIGDANNKRVKLFDNEGLFVCILDLDVDSAISDIHLTSNGLLMVMSKSKHVVKIFKLESNA